MTPLQQIQALMDQSGGIADQNPDIHFLAIATDGENSIATVAASPNTVHQMILTLKKSDKTFHKGLLLAVRDILEPG